MSPQQQTSFEEYLGATASDEPEEVPLLYVDINLGPENLERIIVYRGNKAEDLAENFSLKHGKYKHFNDPDLGLNEDTKQKLVALLFMQIQNVLA